MNNPHPLELACREPESVRILEEVLAPTTPYNRQLFENRPESCSNIEQDQKEALDFQESDRLFNSKSPNLAILTERPWHRAVAYMVAQGCTNREIAVRFERSEAWISQLTRQPWFQIRVTQELKEAGQDKVQNMLEAQVVPSIETVIRLRDSAGSEPVRLNAAMNLIDRFCGKPTLRTETKATVDIHATVTTVEAIDEETKRVEAQLAQLRSTN